MNITISEVGPIFHSFGSSSILICRTENIEKIETMVTDMFGRRRKQISYHCDADLEGIGYRDLPKTVRRSIPLRMKFKRILLSLPIYTERTNENR